MRGFSPILPALLVALPAAGQGYQYFPGDARVDDSRTVALAGEDFETLAQDFMSFLLIVPPGEDSFEIGIFDGETGLRGADGLRHWDNGATELQYALFYDPYQTGTTDPANLVGVWRGNQINPTADRGLWTADHDHFPDNDWWSLRVTIPEPPEPIPGQAPSGTTSYHLCVSYAAETRGGNADPCTGTPRAADLAPETVSNFKLRATANISVVSFAFAYEAALRPANADLAVVYPEMVPGIVVQNAGFFLDSSTTYDGTWSFHLDVPVSVGTFELFDGDFDFGTDVLGGYPSGRGLVACHDEDDADTPNLDSFPPFAVGHGGERTDDSLAESARAFGSPPDDNRYDLFRRSPCVRYAVTSPGPDGDLATSMDNVTYHNLNPSSQREWERFLISTAPGCDDSPSCDPASGLCADHCETGRLPAGQWRVDVEGVDLSNLNAWRAGFGFCTNCAQATPPYLIGDTVFADFDGDGVQESGEYGIADVLLELVDEAGAVLETLPTGDSGAYPTLAQWTSCQQRNTGGATPDGLPIDETGLYCFDVAVVDEDPQAVDLTRYTVRVASSNFAPGGALHDFFGGVPEATRPSPEQTNAVVEGGDNVMAYDFGYWLGPCGPCEGKATALTFRYLGGAAVDLRIVADRGPSDDVVFEDTLVPGEIFTVVGPGGGGGFAGTLGTEIAFYLDGALHTRLHTSCSVPLGPGLVVGDFRILSGASREGGPFCPVTESSREPDDEPAADDEAEPPGEPGPGTGTIGYWKNHPEAWPVTTLTLGGREYGIVAAVDLLWQPARGDASIQLVHQLVAAKLNVALGNPSECIHSTLAAADAWLAAHPPGSGPKGAAKAAGGELAEMLDDYNNGRLCAPHRG